MLNHSSLRSSPGILLSNRNSLCDPHNWHDGILHHVAELGEAHGAVPPADALHRGNGCWWTFRGWLTERRLKGQDQVPLPPPAAVTSSFQSHHRPQPHTTLGQVCCFHGHIGWAQPGSHRRIQLPSCCRNTRAQGEAYDAEFPPFLIQS